MDYIIETENLTKRYGTATVVDKAKFMVCSAETEQAKPQQ